MSFFKYTHSGITIQALLDDRKGRATKDGLFQVRIRVYQYYDRKYYKTGVVLSQAQWDELPTTRKPHLIREREKIRLMFDKCVFYTDKILQQKGLFSLEAFDKAMGIGNAIDKSINVAFQTKIKQLAIDGRIGNSLAYQSALNSFERFAGTNILFTKVTVDWLKKYERHQIETNHSPTTIGIYLRCLRAIINEAIRNGDLPSDFYPFGRGKYEIPSAVGRKLALSFNDVQRVINFDCKGNENMECYRDLWTFSYLCNGANFNDILRLRHENIVGEEIYFVRGKTETTSKKIKEVVVYLHPKLKELIEKWGTVFDRNDPHKYIFPYLNGDESPAKAKAIISDVIKRTNKRLKIISDELELSTITTYTARHSFATVLKRSGANLAYISESLGHSDLKTTENYLASFEIEERKKNAMLLMEN